MLFQGLEVLASFTESFMAFWVYAKIFQKEMKYRESIIAALFLTASVFCLNRIALFSVFITILGVFLISLGVYIVYRDHYVDCVAVIGVYMMLVYIIDFFVISLLGYFLGIVNYADMAILGQSWQRTLGMVIAKICMVLSCHLIAGNFNRIPTARKKIGLAMLGGIVLVYSLIQKTFSKTDANTLLIWVYLLTVVSLAIYAIMQRRELLVEKEKKVLEEKINFMSEQNYKLYAQNQEKNRIFYHDLKNQLILVKEYMANRQYDKAEKFLDHLEAPGASEYVPNLTGMEAADILINYKRNIAKQEGIVISVVAEPINLRLLDYEAVALFGNLLDNAIDACRKIEKERRKIFLEIRKVKDMTFIKVENAYGDLTIEKGEIISGKAEKDRHGMGLFSIRSIVEKYEGTVRIEHDNHQFSVFISFFN